MILIVNLNLAVDEIVHLDELRVGGVHRFERTVRQAGGKGVNIARVLGALNEDALLMGFLGGQSGDLIARQLQREEIRFAATPIQDESRTCFILDDHATRTQTVINEAGPEVSTTELQLFMDDYARLVSASNLIVITGSLPPKLPPETYAQLIFTASEKRKPVLLDTSCVALRTALPAQPFIVKINSAEACELLGFNITGADSAASAARQLIAAGARHAMITLGADGAILNFEGVEYRIKPPRIEALNSVGSGDAVMAGLAAGLVRGLDAEEMARLAIAAGAANALRGMGRTTAEEVFRLMQNVTVS